MSKKYENGTRQNGEMSVEEEARAEMEVNDIQKNIDKLMDEINSLGNGEERTRAIQDLEIMERINAEKQSRQFEKEKAEFEKQIQKLESEDKMETERHKREVEERKEIAENEIRNKELALQEEQVKNSKRGTIVSALVSVGTTLLSFFAYGYLLSRQNEFERDDTYSTSGSRGLTQNIGRLPKIR